MKLFLSPEDSCRCINKPKRAYFNALVKLEPGDDIAASAVGTRLTAPASLVEISIWETILRVHSGPQFLSNRIGNGIGMMVHRVFAFGFDHDAGQGFGAAVADDHAP